MSNYYRRAIKCSIVFIVFLISFNNVYAQKISINVKNTSLEQVLKIVNRQTGYRFSYTDAINAAEIIVSVNISDTDPIDFFKTFFKQYGINYKINGKLISLSSAKEETEHPSSTKPIKGKITDEAGEPLVGVAVKNETAGTIAVSDIDGNYSIAAKENDRISFSLIGMETWYTTAGKSAIVNVPMRTDVIALNDVVVTGYQTISKERATGSYAIVNADVISQKPTANIASVLNGLVPGMAAQNSSVDGSTRFIIRGQGTLQSDQTDRDPLVVVDGFPINGFSSGEGSGLSSIKDPFSTINPNDIENITVLKDAAATSIYGARAANGVIVITTKKGKMGTKLDISVDAFTSVSSMPDLDYAFNMASAENQFRYAELMQNYNPITVSASSDPYNMPSARRSFMPEQYRLLFERDGIGSMSSEEYNTAKQQLINYANQGLWKKDLEKYVFRKTQKQQYNVALRGASEKMNYAFSASYDGDNGYSKGNNSRRIILNIGSSAKLTKNLTFNINLNTTFAKRENNGLSVSELRGFISPWSRLTDENGEFIHVPMSGTVYYPILMSEYEGKTPASWLYNPVTDRQYQDEYSKNMNYRIQGGFDYRTEWGLKLSAKGQYEYRRYDTHSEYDPESFTVRNYYNTYSSYNAATGRYVSYFPAGGILSDGGDRYEGYNLRGQADYNKKFGKHEITVLAGTEIISSSTNNVPTVYRYGFNKNTYSVQSTADYITRKPDIFGVSSLMPYQGLGAMACYEERYFSVFANLGYSFNDKFQLTASFRTDATNYQAESVRDKFSPFWSVGGSYNLSKENFMQNTEWVNLLKVRASVGIAGVSAGKKGNSSVTTLKVYSGDITYSNNEPFSLISMRGNPTLTWEKSRTLNIGADFGLFDNILNGSIDYYNKFSYDVLAKATVPVISQGTTTATYNNAEIKNNGIEISLGTNLRIYDELMWNGNLNFAYNNNKVTKYSVTSSSPTMNLDFLEGYALNSVVVLKPKGYTENGEIILAGKDGTDEIIKDMTTSHTIDQIERQNGKTLDDLNYTYYLGTTTPKYNMGFSNRFSYKGLTLSFMITGRFDYYVYRGDQFQTRVTNTSYSKKLDDAFRVYDEGYANQSSYSAFPLYNDSNSYLFNASSCYMYMGNAQIMFDNNWESGSHIRLQEVYLGYDLPKGILSKQNVFSKVNIFAQGTNLGFIWRACKDIDPDYSIYSIKPMATFTVGLKLNFK